MLTIAILISYCIIMINNHQIIANEMKVLLKLPDDKINEIKKQIEKFVEQNDHLMSKDV